MTAFPIRHVYTAWGPDIGGQWENSIGSLIALAKHAGLEAIALQASRAKAKHAQQIHDAGLKVIAWDVGGGPKDKLEALNPDAVVAQIEGAGQYDGAIACFDANPAPGKPRGVITSYAGLSTAAAWAELARRGVTDCMVECYKDDGSPHDNVAVMLWQGAHDGLPAAALHPTVGTYRGELPSAYIGLEGFQAKTSFWIAEMMDPSSEPGHQWDVWAKFLATAPHPVPVPVPPAQKLAYWDVVAGAETLHTEQAKTYAPGDDGLERAFDWCKANKPTVRAAKVIEVRWAQR